MKIKYIKSPQLQKRLFGYESYSQMDNITKSKLGNMYYQPMVECKRCKTKFDVDIESVLALRIQERMLQLKKYYVELIDPKDCLICTRGLGDSPTILATSDVKV
jgi:hypothetical protein